MKNETLIQVNQLLAEGEYVSVKIICMEALSQTQDDPEALYMLGSIHLVQKRFEESRKLLETLIEHHPRHRNGLNNLGNCFLALGAQDSAADCFEKVLRLDPEDAIALNNLGAIASRNNDHQHALEYYRRALAVLADDREVLANLIVSYAALGEHEEGLKLALYVLKMSVPGVALFPAFNLAKQCCFWDETDEALLKLLETIDEEKVSFSELEHVNLSLLTFPELSHDSLFGLLKKSGERIEALRECSPFIHDQETMSSSTKWRVGYLSPDFRNHVVSTFFRGLINHHDRSQFEVYCYSNTKNEDAATAQYRQSAEMFVDVTGLTDRQLAERIHEDGIHFLIDLAGFTEHGRLPVLSYCPAPIQILYLGYPYTSGLSSVDYVISDPYLDGPKNADYFTEKQLRLPESFVSYGDSGTQEIAGTIPWVEHGYITFGSLVNPYKLNREIVRMWSQILNDLEASRLILNHPIYRVEAVRSNLKNAFLSEGVKAAQLAFCWEKHPEGHFLKYYNEIDIVLDSFPATGGATTLDALCMGKPVMTLVGDIFPERLSYSILKNIGINLEALMAFSPQEYLEKTLALARDPERIIALHEAIPKALTQSILCDPARFTRQVEGAFIEAWHNKFNFIPISKESPVLNILVSAFEERGGLEHQDG